MNSVTNKKIVLFVLFILFQGLLKAESCHPHASKTFRTKTPIKHLVVIIQENRSFDHYFGTYPYAQNNPGETRFTKRKNTPTINGLNNALKHQNQNLVQPFRLSPFNITTADPPHKYTQIQQTMDSGLMDKFVQVAEGLVNPPQIVMGYYDGNTVTAYWNYAQYFAMSDNFHATSPASSTVGAINLISGQTHGALPSNSMDESTPITIEGTLVNDIDPKYDECSETEETVELIGTNIGDLLNAKGVTWGWFQGGFANCAATHVSIGGQIVQDYVPHHNPFQYYQATSNPNHLPPTSPKMVGKTDQANHLYDISDFWAAAEVGNIPAVSFFKAPAYQDGHPGYSSPLLEQEFIVSTINKLQALPEWKDMAIIIAYDDSGGWYDHQMPPIVNQSQTYADALTGPGKAGSNPPAGGYQGRPGYGLRLPLILISPWAKENFVDSTLIDQTSILRFIEDNWSLGRIGNFSFDNISGSLLKMFNFKRRVNRVLLLDPKTGQIIFRM